MGHEPFYLWNMVNGKLKMPSELQTSLFNNCKFMTTFMGANDWKIWDKYVIERRLIMITSKLKRDQVYIKIVSYENLTFN